MQTDTQLQHDVLAEFEWKPSIDASKIGITAKDGVVTLTGSVASYADKMTAERVAKRVYGVKAVANDVEVTILGTSQPGAGDIAAAALNVLKWDTVVAEGRVQVTVRNGWITLSDNLDCGYQKEASERLVRNLTGVIGL
jgi:osmotically-inducible protein OsmY